jgi:hypothetical protein
LSLPILGQKDAKTLVEKMVEACGGKEKFYSLGNVQYEYTYQDLASGKKDVSIEQYIFDGELSRAKYTTRENIMVPDMKGEMIQGYNGKESWVTIDGQLVDDPQLHKFTDFLRKTNYYWFTMMFKLLDPGVNYEYAGTKEVDGISHDLVKITFGEKVGDVQDTYVLFINPETHMVDQFLFTVLDFNIIEPNLMIVKYEEIEGLKLPTNRKYAPSDWDGNVKEDKWTAEISKDIVFNNAFSKEIFEKPGN